MNSVIFIFLLSSACWANSSSLLSLCWSLLSFLYLAPLDFEDLPWSFSRVSLICFWISSSVGSTFWFKFFDLLSLLNLFARSLGWETSLLILFLLLFLDSSTWSSFFLIESKSMTSPVFFKPVNFWKFVWIFDESSGSFFSSSFSNSFWTGLEISVLDSISFDASSSTSNFSSDFSWSFSSIICFSSSSFFFWVLISSSLSLSDLSVWNSARRRP